MCCIYKKFWSQTPICPSFWLKIWTTPSQLNGFSSEMLRFVRNVRDNLCKTLSIFLPQPRCMKSWYHDKIYVFRTLFAFYTILKRSSHMFVVMIREQDVRNSLLFYGCGLTLDSITWILFFNSLYFVIQNTCSWNLTYPQKICLMK